MADLKTKPTGDSVRDFINSVPDEQKRQDSFAIVELMKSVTQAEPVMWGASMIGFGNYHYKYDSGREGDFFITGFAPRKQALTLYIHSGFEQYEALLQKLGKYKIGKSCLYINRLKDIDLTVLRELVQRSHDYMTERYSS